MCLSVECYNHLSFVRYFSLSVPMFVTSLLSSLIFLVDVPKSVGVCDVTKTTLKTSIKWGTKVNLITSIRTKMMPSERRKMNPNACVRRHKYDVYNVL